MPPAISATDSNTNNGFKQPKDGINNAPFLNGTTAIMKYTLTPAAGAANVCEVTISQLDAEGTADTQAAPFMWWLSDSPAGVGLTATTASGAVGAKAANGADFGVLTTKKCAISQPLATGNYILSITDTAKTGFYVCVQCPYTGQVTVSDQLTSANYG